jgi:hypothetical protein
MAVKPGYIGDFAPAEQAVCISMRALGRGLYLTMIMDFIHIFCVSL